MSSVIIYTTRFCPFCIRAKQLLNAKQVDFQEISVDGNAGLRADMAKKAGRTSVPQIWINDQHIGGCDDLFALESSGSLDALLSTN